MLYDSREREGERDAILLYCSQFYCIAPPLGYANLSCFVYANVLLPPALTVSVSVGEVFVAGQTHLMATNTRINYTAAVREHPAAYLPKARTNLICMLPTYVLSRDIHASKQQPDNLPSKKPPISSIVPGKHDQSWGEADSSWIWRKRRTMISPPWRNRKPCCIGPRLIGWHILCTRRALPRSRPSVRTLPSLPRSGIVCEAGRAQRGVSCVCRNI